MVAQLAFENRVQTSECGQYLLVFCKDFKQAFVKSKKEKELWASWAARMQCLSTRLIYGKGKSDYFCVLPEMANESSPLDEFPIAPQIHILSPLPSSPELFRTLAKIAENPGEKYFLHRISPDCNRMIQIMVSPAAESLIVGATAAQAIGRKRSDYMPPDELERMQRTFRQDLSIGGRGIEFSFKLFSPATGADWRSVDYEYQLIGELPGGDLLQLGKCVGVQPIAAPVR